MEKKHLVWEEEKREKVFDCSVFSVWKSYCRAPGNAAMQVANPQGASPHGFTVIDAPDWVIVVPVMNSEKGKQFVMVWQWRFGTKSLSLEFPGGVLEPTENPEQAAARELTEETGYYPGKIKKIGEFCPNPAIMSNKVHFFLAEDLSGDGIQNLDKDEYVEAVLVNCDEVIKGMGKQPYIHALMGTALAMYLKT